MSSFEDEKRRMVQEARIKHEMQGKSPGVALLLSFLLPGLGDLYCGSWIKAIVFFILDILSFTLMFLGIGFFTYWIVWFFGLISAMLSAKKSASRKIRRMEQALSEQS